jgi:hypothetical protein
MQGLWNIHNTVIRRTRRPLHPCGSIMAGVYGGIAPTFLGMRYPDSGPLFASSLGLLLAG